MITVIIVTNLRNHNDGLEVFTYHLGRVKPFLMMARGKQANHIPNIRIHLTLGRYRSLCIILPIRCIGAVSFNAWGRRRSPTNWNNYTVSSPTLLYRGYTGHEHLDEFSLINMNGRCYDPVVGRFLSPDNFIQMPYFSQNYNRYSYALNNPLKFTDPSGNSLVITLISLAVSYISQQFFSPPDNSNISAEQQNRSSLIGMGVSAIINNIIPGANGILKGIFMGGLSGGISGGLAAGIDAKISGGNFGEAFWTGFKSGAITGGVMGGANGYLAAKKHNLNVWTGTPKRNDYLLLANYFQTGEDYLVYNGRNLNWYDENDNLVDSYNATSGLPGHQIARYQNIPDAGPIPEGTYMVNLRLSPNRMASIDPSTGEVLSGNGIQNIPESFTATDGTTWTYPGWGTMRARLNPISGNMHGRHSFYLHNSHKGYSHGCIEVGGNFFGRLITYGQSNSFIRVIVRYPSMNTSTYGRTYYP